MSSTLFSPESISEKVAQRIAVVGADGFLGGCLADAFAGKRIVYGPCQNGDVHVSAAQELLQQADIVINAGGFRVRPGCTYADYQRSHQGATAAIVPCIRRDALLVHISSASVLGSAKTQKLGAQAIPNPKTFPAPAYAMAKLEADRFVEQAAAAHGFRVIFIRPAVVYSPNGAGMIETMIRLAKRGVTLRLYPRSARHHLCHTSLLVDVFRRVIEQSDRLPHLSCFIAADPYTITNRELEAMIQRHLPGKRTVVPMPVGLMSAVLKRTFHSRIPKLDLKTWGEIFGVLNYDTEYDPSDTFTALGLNPSRYSMEKTLEPLIREALQ
jgi:nucleoside-diphosphate-sugar epimerase